MALNEDVLDYLLRFKRRACSDEQAIQEVLYAWNGVSENELQQALYQIRATPQYEKAVRINMRYAIRIALFLLIAAFYLWYLAGSGPARLFILYLASISFFIVATFAICYGVFLKWQLKEVTYARSLELPSDTVLEGDWTVFNKKTLAGGNQFYVMIQNNLCDWKLWAAMIFVSGLFIYFLIFFLSGGYKLKNSDCNHIRGTLDKKVYHMRMEGKGGYDYYTFTIHEDKRLFTWNYRDHLGCFSLGFPDLVCQIDDSVDLCVDGESTVVYDVALYGHGMLNLPKRNQAELDRELKYLNIYGAFLLLIFWAEPAIMMRKIYKQC